MCDYAGHNFRLDQPGKDGISQREHLTQVQKQTGREIPELEGPPFPQALVHVWSAFIDLSKCRSSGFSAPNPITYSDIKAYMETTLTPLNPVEVQGIRELDNAYLGAYHE